MKPRSRGVLFFRDTLNVKRETEKNKIRNKILRITIHE